MAPTFQLLLLVCLACGALAARGADDAGWFGAPSADANLVTTPVIDQLDTAANDTVVYDDEEYFDSEADAVEVEVTAKPSPTTTTASAPVSRNSSAATNATTSKVRTTTVSSSAKPPEARRAKAASNSGKTEEVNYWQTDGLADQPTGGSSRSSASEEAREEPQVSVKEHDRNPHPFAFSSSGDNEWFGFGGGGGGGGGFNAEAGGGGSKSRLGSSASVAVEDYQTKEQIGPKDVELESVVEIKEHDELAPGAGGGFSASSGDSQWFGDFGSSSKSGGKSPPSDGGGGGGDDVWFGVEASEWQPVAASSHRQQRKLNWDEDETPAESDGDAARDYEALDIITAPPDAGRSRDVYSFVVESSFGGGDRRGRGSAKKDTDGVDEVEIVTAAPGADLGWFGAGLEERLTEAPQPATKKVVVKSRTSTTTVRLTVVGRSRFRAGVSVSRNHSFVDLLAKKANNSATTPPPEAPLPAVESNRSSAIAPQNSSAAPTAGAREEGNSVNAAPRNESPTTTPKTTTPPTTTTSTTAAPTTTTTTSTTTAPEVTKNIPQVIKTAVIDKSNQTATGHARAPVSSKPAVKEESSTTPSTPDDATKTTTATVLPTRSGRTFAEVAPHPKNSQNSREEAPPGRRGDAPANFTAASAASESRTVVLRGDANRGAAATNDNLSYILVGTCCGVSLVCLAVVVIVVRRRKSLRRRRRSPHPPFQQGQLYPPASYSYPPSARVSHFATPSKDGSSVAPSDAKARMWFMGRKQSPYSLCDQHLSYCSRDAASDYKPTDGGRRHSDGGALSMAAPPPPPPTAYRTGFSGLSDARHSSGLDYMNKGEMIYWSSNNEQLI